jgi:hypothetical protein
MDSPSPEARRTLSRLMILVAALLILVPLIDFVSNIWPLKLAEARWRFGGVGLISGYLVTPLLGDLMLMIATATLERRIAQRGLAVCNLLGAIVLAGILVSYPLDVLQLRGSVPADSLALFDGAAIRSVVKLLLLVVAFLWLAIAGFRLSRRTSGSREGRRKTDGSMLVTGEKGRQA